MLGGRILQGGELLVLLAPLHGMRRGAPHSAMGRGEPPGCCSVVGWVRGGPPFLGLDVFLGLVVGAGMQLRPGTVGLGGGVSGGQTPHSP